MAAEDTTAAENWGTINLETYRRGGPQRNYRLSTEFDYSSPDNPLVPLTGQTMVEKTLVGTDTIRLRCRIDNTKIDASVDRLLVSGRVGPQLEPDELALFFRHDTDGTGLITLLPLDPMNTRYAWKYEKGDGSTTTQIGGSTLTTDNFVNNERDELTVFLRVSNGIINNINITLFNSIVGALDLSAFPDLRDIQVPSQSKMRAVFFNFNSHAVSNLNLSTTGIFRLDMSNVVLTAQAPSFNTVIINCANCTSLGTAGGIGQEGYHVILPSAANITILRELRFNNCTGKPKVNWHELSGATNGTFTLIDLTANNYTEGEVDNILTEINAATPQITGTLVINIGGGSSVAPSGVGLAAQTAMEARNITVNTN